MGRGDNRRSRKMRRKISWRKNKARIAKRIAAGKSAPKAPKAKAAGADSAPSAVVRDSAES